MHLTWIAIIASLLMGIGAVLIFVFAVKQDYFRDIEETKYQVFWSDVEELVESTHSISQACPATREGDHRNEYGQQERDGAGRGE
jgi:hypothetical protein